MYLPQGSKEVIVAERHMAPVPCCTSSSTNSKWGTTSATCAMHYSNEDSWHEAHLEDCDLVKVAILMGLMGVGLCIRVVGTVEGGRLQEFVGQCNGVYKCSGMRLVCGVSFRLHRAADIGLLRMCTATTGGSG